MMKSFTKHLLSLAIVLLSSLSLSALAPGDIAFVQYNADGNEQFAWVALVNIPANQVISFTENGWLAAGGFRTGEGTIDWTAPAGGLPAGTIVTIDNSATTSHGFASETGSFALSGSGDQIIAFTGASGAPNLITAINGNGAWDANASSTNTSALPAGLTDGVNAIAIDPEVDNIAFDIASLTGNAATLAAAINTNANWTGGSGSVLQYYAGTITVTNPSSPTGPAPIVLLADSDLLFIAFNSDNPDIFSFVTTNNIPGNTTVSFTENGWLAAGGFRSGEGTVTWTTPLLGVPVGTVVTYNSSAGFDVGTTGGAGTIFFSTSGDQIFAFQTANGGVSLIAGLHMNGGWDADATSSTTSALPPNLVGAIASCGIEVDNSLYNGPLTGTPIELKASILDPGNWNCSDTPFPLTTAEFDVTVPTMSEWGLIVLALLLLNFVFVTQFNAKLALANGMQTETGLLQTIRSAPFNASMFKNAVLMVLLIVVTITILTLAVYGELAMIDITGTMIATPLMAYLIHLVNLNNKK